MKTVVFDFDGVIHSYKSGWKGIDVIPDPPVDGIGDTIAELRADGYEVVVVSTRCAEECGILAVKQYLDKNGIVVDRVMKEKPPAIVYIDDRAICFDGNAKALVDKVKGFKNWLEEEKEMKTEVVRINLHGNEMPVSHGEWVDLYTAEDVRLGPLDFKIISLGYAMELPEGYYAQVVPRSSTCKNWGIIMANSVGIIENTYCGDNDVWGFPAVAIRDTTIPKGTRICQFRLCKKEVMPEFVPVESLGNPDRGGWGSTGNK